MSSNDFVTLFFIVAAVLVFWQLRSVLGRRTGHEKPPVDPFAGRQSEKQVNEDRVVTLAKRDDVSLTDRFALIDAYVSADKPLNGALRAVVEADPSFQPKEFIKGAGIAYEMIVTAFATGDRATLRDLLSHEVMEGFETAIREREAKGEQLKSMFVGIDKADITGAVLKGSEVQITLRLISQLISARYDREGKLIEGDPDAVTEVKDFWTFARDTRSNDPNWKLIATESEQ